MASGGAQLVGEAGDRHVGDRQQPVEDDPEIAAELVPVLVFKLRLRRRQRRTDRVVREIQAQLAAPESGGIRVGDWKLVLAGGTVLDEEAGAIGAMRALLARIDAEAAARATAAGTLK